MVNAVLQNTQHRQIMNCFNFFLLFNANLLLQSNRYSNHLCWYQYKMQTAKMQASNHFYALWGGVRFFFTGGQAHVGLELLNMVLFISRYIIKYYSKISPVLRGNS